MTAREELIEGVAMMLRAVDRIGWEEAQDAITAWQDEADEYSDHVHEVFIEEIREAFRIAEEVEDDRTSSITVRDHKKGYRVHFSWEPQSGERSPDFEDAVLTAVRSALGGNSGRNSLSESSMGSV